MTTTEFCRRELDRYLSMICPEKTEIELRVLPDESSSADRFFEYGEIRVEKGKGAITGNRPRALLLTVYEFLRCLGCVFLRPGKGGEVIPKKEFEEVTVFADFTPANRHRGITIEGAVSLENVLNIVDWAAKVGFNSYYIQFRTVYEFFKRWYTHSSNPLIEKETFGGDQSEEYVKKIVAEIKLRDMIYHAVGHGWTSECLGFPSNGWSGSAAELSSEQKEMIAEIGGERKLFKGIPLNTQLCYSEEFVREKLAEEVAVYAENHPETDVIHFWLADDYNNVCECPQCAKKSLSDWYVMILNRIDDKLTERHIDTKICFLVYFELYWAPTTERIVHEDRFIMMFAPLFRSYTTSFGNSRIDKKIEYKKNKTEYPTNPGAYLNFWQDWKKIFHGDTFDFDYHLMWDINRDFGGETLAKVLFDDVRSLKKFGMNGFMSCQLQRAFYPNGLPFYLLGRALADGSETLDDIRKTYYSAAFGKYATFAEEAYGMLEKYVPFSYVREETSGKKYISLIETGREKIKEKLKEMPEEKDSEVVSVSLSILEFALKNTLGIVECLITKANGAEPDFLEKEESKRMDFFNRNERKFQPYVDGFYFRMITEGIVNSKKTGIYAGD